jgi:hypothetical protein
MKDFSLANLIRYVFPSFVLYIYLLLVNFAGTIYFTKQLQWVGVIAFIFVGSVMYFIYRSLFYRNVIPSIQDFFRTRSKSTNFRTFIKEQYKINSYKANLAWVILRDQFLSEKYPARMMESAAGAHLLYISGILGFLVPILGISLKVCGYDDLWGAGLLLVFVIGLVSCIAAFYWDKSYEDIEFMMFCSLPKVKINTYIKQITKELNIESTTNNRNDSKK